MKTIIGLTLMLLFLTLCTGCGTTEFLGGKSECGTHDYHGHSDDVAVIDSGFVWSIGP